MALSNADRPQNQYGSNRRQASLYDAVAGRVGYEGFLAAPQSSRYRDTASTSSAPVPPEEVLFRRRGAPARFAEDDLYEADRHLEPGALPESDLLKVIHAYASDFYSRRFNTSARGIDFCSMDETALIAMGILLEEAAAARLGKTGDLALVEQSQLEDGKIPRSHYGISDRK